LGVGLELGNLRPSLSEVGLGILLLLLELQEFLLGGQSAVFPALTAEREIATADFLLAVLAFALGGFGFPLVAATDKFGDEDARRSEEIASGSRLLGGGVHVLMLLILMLMVVVEPNLE
jgi:hypothetical protein